MTAHESMPMKPEELEAFIMFKDDINMVVDIGCRENYEYSQIKPEAKMYLFDANEYFISRLNEKIKDNKNLFTFSFGLSNKNIEVEYDDDSESIQKHRFRKTNLTLVRIRKFDEVMKECGIDDKIDFLKIDIEGCEPEILEYQDIIKNIKYVQFEFGRGWPNLKDYNVWNVIEQYKDTHKCYYLKDRDHSFSSDYPSLDLFTFIDKDFYKEIHRRLMAPPFGEGGNIWMIRKDITEKLGV